jgi:hypothetical protein
MEIGTLTGEITLEDTFSSGLEMANEKVKEFAESFEGMAGAVIAGSALIATAIIGVGATVFGLAEHAAKAGEEVEAFSLKTGIAVENVGPLKFAVDAAGGSLDQLNSTLMRMTMKEAADSSGKFSSALKDLGINADAFGRMDAEQKIMALGEGFRKGAENGTNMADAMALMGRGGANMIPTLEKLTPELMAIAQQTAIIWTPESIEAAKQFSVATNIVHQSLANITTRVGAELLPAMSALADALAKDPAFLNAVTTGVDLLAHGLGYAVEAAGYLVTGFISLGAGLVNIYGMLLEGSVKFDQFFLTIVTGLGKIPGMGDKMKGSIEGLTLTIAENQAKVDGANKTYTSMINVGGAVYDTTQHMGQGLLDVGTASDHATESVGKNTKGLAENGKQAAAAAAAQKAYWDAVLGIYDGLAGETKKLYEQNDALNLIIDSGETNTEVVKRTIDMIDKYVKAGGVLTDVQKNWYDSNKTISGSLDNVGMHLTQVGVLVPENTEHIQEMTAEFMNAASGEDVLTASALETSNALTSTSDVTDNFRLSLVKLQPDMKGMNQGFVDAALNAGNFADELGGDLTQALTAMPNLLVKAFTGGGGFSGAISAFGSKFGADVGKSLEKDAMPALTNSLGKTLGGALGSAIPVVGALIGPLIGKLFDSFGPSQAELAGRKAEASFEAGFGGFQGMMDKIGVAYADTGRSAAQAQADVQALFAAEKQGPDAVKAALNTINQVFADQKAKIDSDTTAMGALLKEGATLGITLPQSIQDSIQKLIDMGKVTGDTQSLLSQLTGAQTVNFGTMRDLATKYGADLTQLGPAFEKAKIDDTATTIINDFDTLQRGLGDTDTALTVMKKPINDLVNESIKFGVDIPANMQPWVDQLEKTGQLTDENGNQLTDISKIKFSAPIETQFQLLIDKISKLIDTITGPSGLNAAINSVPNKQTEIVTVHTDVYKTERQDDSAAYASMGGRVTASGVSYYGGGGNVLSPAFVPRGTDTVPAMLTPGETVTSTHDVGSQAQSMESMANDMASIRNLLAAQPGAMAVALKDAIVLLPRRVA